MVTWPSGFDLDLLCPQDDEDRVMIASLRPYADVAWEGGNGQVSLAQFKWEMYRYQRNKQPPEKLKLAA